MSEWISVEAEIPSDDRRVLGTDGKKHEIVCYINSDCEWRGATSDYGYLMSLRAVTHWMPLMTKQNPDKLCKACKEFDSIVNRQDEGATSDIYVVCDHDENECKFMTIEQVNTETENKRE